MSYITPPRAGRGHVAVVTDPETGAYSHSRTFKGAHAERLARNWLTLEDAKKLSGDYVAPKDGNALFGDRSAWWVAHETLDLRSSSKARDLSYLRSQILPTFETVPLRDISHDLIQSWVTMLVAQGYAPATVHKAHGVLSKILKSAVAQKLIPSNPCEHTKLPQIIIEEQLFLDYDQVDELVATIGEHWALAVDVASYTGLRAGELFGLRVRDVHVEGGYLNIRRKVVEVSGRLEFHDYLKTQAGYRQISVPGALMDELAAHVEGAGPDELVFTTPGGLAVRLSNWRDRHWIPACIATGLGSFEACTAGEDPDSPRCWDPDCRRRTVESRSARGHYQGLRLHDLRHTAVSFWIDQKRSMFEITKMLGQTNSNLVDRRYGHLIPKVHDAANDLLDVRRNQARARRNRRAGTVKPETTKPSTPRSRRPAPTT